MSLTPCDMVLIECGTTKGARCVICTGTAPGAAIANRLSRPMSTATMSHASVAGPRVATLKQAAKVVQAFCLGNNAVGLLRQLAER